MFISCFRFPLTGANAQIQEFPLIPALVLAGMGLFLYAFFYLLPVKLWVAARITNTPVSLIEMIGMRLRRIRPELIVNPMIMASQVGIDLSAKRMEAHYLAGGDPRQVVYALIAARKAHLDLDVDQACAVDLVPERDILEIVRNCAEKSESLKERLNSES
ncbi:MAG: flotillin-like FloA family protein [Candidatus Sumerlaeota bacterium]